MIRHKFSPGLLITLGSCLYAQGLKPVVPGVEWERVARPEAVGYSTPKLEALRNWLKTQVTKSMAVLVWKAPRRCDRGIDNGGRHYRRPWLM
jgi:hypothetical protein